MKETIERRAEREWGLLIRDILLSPSILIMKMTCYQLRRLWIQVHYSCHSRWLSRPTCGASESDFSALLFAPIDAIKIELKNSAVCGSGGSSGCLDVSSRHNAPLRESLQLSKHMCVTSKYEDKFHLQWSSANRDHFQLSLSSVFFGESKYCSNLLRHIVGIRVCVHVCLSRSKGKDQLPA
jgi:hypothetical protein